MRLLAPLAVIGLLASALIGLPAQVASADPTTESATVLFSSLTTATPHPAGYVRAQFGSGWIDQTGDGCDTRADVLKAQSAVPVTFTTSGGCTVATGEWHSWYDDQLWTSASDVQIDHLVPLGEAWASGASSWSSAQRVAYANDIGVPYALQAITSSVNESKSDDDPAKWMPPAAAAACQYVTDWMLVKYRWSLTIDSAEQTALTNALATDSCGDTQVTLPDVKIAPTAAVVPPIRYSGSDRYAVAVSISQQFSAGVPVVYVTKGTNYPDSLSAAPAAAAQGGPLLLVNPGSIPDVVAAELARLHPQKIVVVGGEASITPPVFAQLQSYVADPLDVTRIGGADRYQASRNLNTFAFGSTGVSRVYLATGANFPDALSASAVAGSHSGAVLLVDGKASVLDQATRDEIALLHPDDVVIAGGPNSVSTGIQDSLGTLGLPNGSQRLSGSDRFEASAAINHEAYTTANTVYLATGLNFPDALAGAALAGRDVGPLYVVQTNCVPQSTLADIHSFGTPQIVLFGGPNSLGQGVVSLTPCPITPQGSVTFTCSPSPALTATVTNPNSYDITLTIRLSSGASTTSVVPAHSSGTYPGPTPAEDTTQYLSLSYDGVNFLTTTVHRDCTAPPPPPPPPGPPANPGDSKNCSDFATWPQAQAWFNYYYPYYGDVAHLDGDGNGIACQTLPGHP